MKKLMIFTNHFYPETFRINALAETFTKDWDVSVITQVPNYPKGDFFDGYGNFKNKHETRNNIEITRLPVIPRKNNSIMLFLNYISYIVSTFFFGMFTRKKADHVYVYVTSPIFLCWSALRIAKRNKVESTLYLLDLWPESLTSSLNINNKFIVKRLEKMTLKIYKRFDNIIVGSESFIDDLHERGLDRSKMTHIPQHADEILERPVNLPKMADTIKIVFAGNIGTAQGLETLVESVEILDHQNFKNVHITIVGDGRNKDNIIKMVKEKNLESYFTFVDRVPFEEVKHYLSENHFAYVSLQDKNPLNKTLPAKVQSYMAYGIPILGCANGEIPKVINKVQCGVCSDNNASDLANLIKDISKLSQEEYTTMSYNGHRYSEEHFSLETISEAFLRIMKEGI